MRTRALLVAGVVAIMFVIDAPDASEAGVSSLTTFAILAATSLAGVLTGVILARLAIYGVRKSSNVRFGIGILSSLGAQNRNKQ
jgi:hypothetical protein